MSGQDSGLGEFDLIRRYFSALGARRPDVVLGIGDDAALLDVPQGAELVVSVDTIVAGRHFPIDSDARSIGHRALAVNLSDLAAMGATPAWATLAATLPSADPHWLKRFCGGLGKLADEYGVAVVGGDTTAGPLTISVQIMGYVPRGTALRRAGARSGDLLAVTGTLGDSGAGLALAMGQPPCAERAKYDAAAAQELLHRFEYPAPRVHFGLAARGIASAAMDISDGLAGDLPKLLQASGIGARVEIDRLPISPALMSIAGAEQARKWALSAGDDYELLLAVPATRYHELVARAEQLNLRLAIIGELRREKHLSWFLEGTEVAPPDRGYDHFR